MTKIIGLTFSTPANANALYSNGIRQNVLYLHEVLYLLNYNVYLVTDKPMTPNIPTFKYDVYKTVVINSEEYNNIKFDIFIQMGLSVPIENVRKLKSQGTKIIFYKCGNDYIFDMETVLFKSRPSVYPQFAEYKDEQVIDEIWSIPQMENTNYYYWKTRFRCPVKVIPFVWSPNLLESMCKDLPNGGKYIKKLPEKKMVIFEPNLNVFKYALPAVFVCENAYRSLKTDKKADKLKNVYVTNANSQTKNSDYGNFDGLQFSRMTYNLDLYLDKKLSVESRYNSIYFMSRHADIAVSHQWENPLNYLYLDLAWMGWPIVHNAHLCKDIGYYYEGFNYEQGGDILKYVIETHDKIADEYLERNRKLIYRYLPENPELQKQYKLLIEYGI
jgi:hypothetical protein